MPQLSKETAQAVEETTNLTDVVPDGVYTVKLTEVTVGEGPKGPYWTWRFDIPNGEPYAGKAFWTNTSLSPNALWKMAEVFAAFDLPTTTHTDDMIGKNIMVSVGTGVIQQGANAGKERNEILNFLPKTEVPSAVMSDAVPSSTKVKGATKASDAIPF